ncbi:enoyl-CoA hydratase/isomerase family protein [Gemmatimonas phototrophica]|uniref:enoyl-CoA hydratase/isomerase family protein n=1 Tax=Gemmatimonas phototrophica TaxID=1379270 RepID=UPI00047A1F37|nr:enoyl-CoA hydratase/isomerase family protein [Gemmatimonas phototrophica]
MTALVQTVRDGDVLVVTIDHPPVNALSHAVRVGLMDALEQLEADATLGAMVLCSTGTVFIGGADIREFAGPRLDPMLNTVCNSMELCRKPIVAAMQGPALGGGLEVALACHYRVASPAVEIAFPEVLLGLLPGAGGTQRAPRLAGAALALDLMLTARRLAANEAVQAGLLDVVHEQPVVEAMSRAHAFAREGGALRRAREGKALQDSSLAGAEIAAARATLPSAYRNLYSPARIVDCVEAAVTLDFESGSAYESAAFMECLASPQRQALVYAFFAERDVRKSEKSGVDVAALGAIIRNARDASIEQLVHQGHARETVYGTLAAWGLTVNDSSPVAAGPQDIVAHCVGAMEDAAQQALDAGSACAAADCDIASIKYAGFPRYRGGVLWHASHGASVTPSSQTPT